MNYGDIIELVGKWIDIVGVCLIVLGAVTALIRFAVDWFKIKEIEKIYTDFRQNLGRVIILGLEFLVAGDIIRSIAIPPTFTGIGILGLLVIIRSILSIEMGMEIEGHWPWQRAAHREQMKEKHNS